jgi:hypothetical protein
LAGESEVSVRMNPWIYRDGEPSLATASISVLPGVSPVRQALIARGAFPEQELHLWSEQQPSSVTWPNSTEVSRPPGESSAFVDPIAERLLDHTHRALETEAGGSVERLATAFGNVLVAPAGTGKSVAIAVARGWPRDILEVDWIDRDRRSAEVVDVSRATNLLDPGQIAALYRTVVGLKQAAPRGEEDVDNGAA